MIVHINHQQKKITLINLPRDLYYNGRKINSVYHLYGMDEFVRQVALLSGLEIERYILIDMYAFIEVIDFMGGIDVVLDKALIDPSYKTYDDGQWSTLYYKAGEHHLNGTQVLRLARSRHYSSDFARAERQQDIVRAIKKKAANLGFGDAETVLKIISVIIAKTETNISIQEAISYYFRYQNFELQSGGVLSTGNVLKSTYSGELVADKKPQECAEEDPECKVDKGAYILLPRNGDWNVVKWYIREQL
jgi:LCP family protein required for cell wall assembly